MKWLLADMDDKDCLVQSTDILSQLPLTARKNGGVVNASFLHSGPSSQRQSFSNSHSFSDRYENDSDWTDTALHC